MNEANSKQLARSLVEQWSSAPDQGYIKYCSMLHQAVMKVEQITECADFFGEVERQLALKMQINPSGLHDAHEHFMIALRETRAIFKLGGERIRFISR